MRGFSREESSRYVDTFARESQEACVSSLQESVAQAGAPADDTIPFFTPKESTAFFSELLDHDESLVSLFYLMSRLSSPFRVRIRQDGSSGS